MRIIKLKVPENIDLKDYDFSMIVASKLYKDVILSDGQAAEMVGLKKKAFIEMLGKYSISIFNISSSDMQSDILTA